MANTATKDNAKTNGKDEAKDEAKKPSKRDQEKARREAEEKKVRDAKIKAGDLVVVKGVEFEKIGKDTKTLARAKKILATIEKSKAPVVVSEFAKKENLFYEDILPQFAMLEAQGLAVRFEGRGNGKGRRSVAYLHIDQA